MRVHSGPAKASPPTAKTPKSSRKRVSAKLDTCALVNLAHSQHLSDVRPCSKHSLPPIRLTGVGGSTQPITKAGVLNISVVGGQARTALCYVLDDPVAGDKALCLIGLRTLVDWGINLQHHMHESLRGACTSLKLLTGGITANAFRLNAKYNHGQNFCVQETLQGNPCTSLKEVMGNPELKIWLERGGEARSSLSQLQQESLLQPVLDSDIFLMDRSMSSRLPRPLL